MNDRQIDEILKRSEQASHGVDARLLDRVVESIAPSMAPVRPLPSRFVLGAALVAVSAAVALAGAAISGFHGLQKMTGAERAWILPTLAALVWIASSALVNEMIPGSRRRVSPWVLPAASIAALVAIFAVLFRDYHTRDYVHQGIVCLAVGLGYAIPSAIGTWLLLRRGFAVDPLAAGMLIGTIAGLAGVTMLELHCANFEALHLMVWHCGVIPIAAIVARFIYRRSDTVNK